MSNSTVLATPLQGWTNSPDYRGTMNIVLSCTFTIFICVWSVLCVNIGPHGESTWAKIYRKLKLAGLCILGPDFLLLLTIGQWESARSSCRKFKERGIDNWSMRHSFYADMGGFAIQTGEGVTWPLDANEILYLIEKEWIKGPVISTQFVLDKNEIDDRNKQGILLRVSTIVQVLWFLMNCIARKLQHLTITTLELTTIGFIITTIGVFIFWFDKPADVETRRIINVSFTISEIHARAGQEHVNWYDTPLDFLKAERSYYEVAWRYCLNILSAIFMMNKDQARPIKWRRDDIFPVTSITGIAILAFFGILSWGTNFIAWNSIFPTILEKQAWRVCSSILSAVVIFGETYHRLLLTCFPDMKKGACDRFDSSKSSIILYDPKLSAKKPFFERLKRRKDRLVLKLSNISPNQDPSLTMQLRVLLPALFCGAAYIIARGFILVEDVIAFRGQDPDIYKTLNWVEFFPHV
ncbi:uncharacterized protein EAE97_000387 [Botrytis byssoidea]|uniref:Uncharacterized protein n=1 Tax=Botrytis byssoidea TaxID=139641 RepID=A0A9P5IYR0_9HELO|nr:uncharacterized protein EAE97_000387 [Botrytis byssoidea]KAF7955128.1 hypothetical protein EAE97_000387 [Botrytis byssoidea]